MLNPSELEEIERKVKSAIYRDELNDAREEVERLHMAFRNCAHVIERLANELPPSNPVTPQLLFVATAMRQAVTGPWPP